ncbi:RING finger protein 225-like [Leucoraja erinacea]|uniref:RING finger protein 225-like n=1 Tax=Leucoraja erinaceus TaxID=7782 RepID=UPI00245504D7|nr:RING finger protein 225-like [Leucoraja erinacea]
MNVSEEKDYDLECSICFSNYNNVFRTPKQLACNHTFCLECLARMNMKAQVAEAIQCPVCRSLTRVPKDGLPKLGNNSGILSCLPEAMQRIQSIRFNRGKGRLFVKKTQWSQKKRGKKKMFASSVSQSLDVGRPSDMDNHQVSVQRWWCCVHKSYVTIVIVIIVTLAILISSIWVFVVR